MILIPVKNLRDAKQRLAPLLDHESRVLLARAMLYDVLETIWKWPHRPEVAVVSGDLFAADLARNFDFQIIPDNFNRSETDAIAMATRTCEARGAQSTLVIPGDIPLVKSAELQAILDAAPAEGSVLVPAADGRGTNAAWRSPGGLFPLRFGNDSFQPHLAAANATGKPCVLLSLPGVALDVDTPSDLLDLIAAPGETRAQRLARQWGLEDFPLAANE
jgi:2-phospho-L-lactate guanylyltransferase